MSVLAAAYVNEIAEGRVPAQNSPEAKAYLVWSIVRESGIKVYGHQYFLLGSLV